MSGAIQTEVAGALLAGFADAGVRDVVVSPGSRNTPFVLAARDAGLSIHVVIDERAAAFFALGMARVTGRPVLLSCTSGSAGAHYFPAVVEASSAHVPLLVLTADRPHDAAACGAPQTIDQVGLFGRHVRSFQDVAVPDERTSQLDAAMRVASQALATSLSPDPGPVHVNVRAAKPLEPTAPTTDAERAFHAARRAAVARGTTRVWRAVAPADEAAIEALAQSCRHAERGLIVAGPASLGRRAERAAVFALARATGFPLAADATSQLRFVGGSVPDGVVVADGMASCLGQSRVRAALAADLVIQIGEPPVASGWESYCAEQRARERWVIAPHGWCDPYGRADARIVAEVGPTAAALARRLETRPVRATHAWTLEARAVSDAWWRAIERADDGGFDETNVVRDTVAALPPGALLVVGNSRVVRLLESCRAPSAEVAVMSQRGASGIDGLVAGAAGAAHAWTGPVALLIGDVSFVHDVGALAIARTIARPVVIVVVNNDGGRIFEDLPVARAWGARPEPWTTPHALDLARIAGAFDVAASRVTSTSALRAAIGEAWDRRGATLVEACVPASAERARKQRMEDALDAASKERTA